MTKSFINKSVMCFGVKDLYKVIGTIEILQGLVCDGKYTEIVSQQTGELFNYSDIQKSIYLLESMVNGVSFEIH